MFSRYNLSMGAEWQVWFMPTTPLAFRPLRSNWRIHLCIACFCIYKLEGERVVRQLLKRYCVLRFSNVYGNAYDIPDRVIPKFVRTALQGGELVLEGGEQIIDFTHIDDTVASIIQCMNLLQSERILQDTIHILPGVPNKITDIIGLLRNQGLQFTVRTNAPRSYDVQRFVGSTVRREQLLGKRNFIRLEEGIRWTLRQLSPKE